MRAKILNEVINAKIIDIIIPEPYIYNWERLVESSRKMKNPIQIILDNGEILLLFGMIRLSDE